MASGIATEDFILSYSSLLFVHRNIHSFLDGTLSIPYHFLQKQEAVLSDYGGFSIPHHQ